MPSYDDSAKYRTKLKCLDCGHRYIRVIRSLDDPDPPCPKCNAAARPRRGLKFNGRAPAAGGSNISKAMAFAESEAARQSSFTNLRTPTRPGDVMAPALPPAQQAQADSMFAPRNKTRPNAPATPRHVQAQNAAAVAAVNAGSFARNDDARFVSQALSARIKPQINYINRVTR